MIFINNEDILKFALENGIINLADVQEKIEMTKRKELLSRHKYEIWLANDGYWKTYLPDETKKNGRKSIKRKSIKDLENEIINYQLELERLEEKKKEEKKKQSIILKDLFYEWIEYKTVHTNSSSYIRRIIADWDKYYIVSSDFINKPIQEFTAVELDRWAHTMIKDKNLSKKQYYNMSVILRQSLDYAVSKEYIESNPFANVKINTKMFRKIKKKKSETQVYMVDEVKLMIEDMIRRFNNDPSNTAPLAVLLDFEIGARIGELLALRESDISPDWNYIHIQRQVVRTYEKIDPEGYKMKLTGSEVVEYTKSDDGDREVYLTDIAKKLIRLVLYTNQKYGHKCEDFLFVQGTSRMTHYSIQARINRGCEKIGILTKTAHKIRKTYISTLIDSGLNIDEIRRQAGHSDERTTYGNYCFNRLPENSTQKLINEALEYDMTTLFNNSNNISVGIDVNTKIGNQMATIS